MYRMDSKDMIEILHTLLNMKDYVQTGNKHSGDAKMVKCVMEDMDDAINKIQDILADIARK